MRTIGALIFPGFEILDLFGPLEMFGMLPDEFNARIIAQGHDPVASTQGPRTAVDVTTNNMQCCDLLLVPGGAGTRTEVHNGELLGWIKSVSAQAEIVMSVCTGSALLAQASVLDGKRATTNKRAFDWVCSQAPEVAWVRRARWVHDGNVYTSSGVSAGIDMSLAVISQLLGQETAEQVASWAEYQWNDDPGNDPFAT